MATSLRAKRFIKGIACMPNDVEIEIFDVRLSHRTPGPWKAEHFKSGLSAVTNALGINWISGCQGGTLFASEVAEEIAAAFNASHPAQEKKSAVRWG